MKNKFTNYRVRRQRQPKPPPKDNLANFLRAEWEQMEAVGWSDAKIESYLAAVRDGAIRALYATRHYFLTNKENNLSGKEIVSFLEQWVEGRANE